MEQTLKPSSKAWGAPAWLTQADVLQVIGPALSARSDTFVIRALGDAGFAGEVRGAACLEAVVQRLPEPAAPGGAFSLNEIANASGRYGRRFKIISMRWVEAP